MAPEHRLEWLEWLGLELPFMAPWLAWMARLAGLQRFGDKNRVSAQGTFVQQQGAQGAHWESKAGRWKFHEHQIHQHMNWCSIMFLSKVGMYTCQACLPMFAGGYGPTPAMATLTSIPCASWNGSLGKGTIDHRKICEHMIKYDQSTYQTMHPPYATITCVMWTSSEIVFTWFRTSIRIKWCQPKRREERLKNPWFWCES